MGVEICMLEPPSDLGFPVRLDGEYRHSIPQVRHREHNGLALEHLTFARKQPSQEARRRGWRGFVEAMIGERRWPGGVRGNLVNLEAGSRSLSGG